MVSNYRPIFVVLSVTSDFETSYASAFKFLLKYTSQPIVAPEICFERGSVRAHIEFPGHRQGSNCEKWTGRVSNNGINKGTGGGGVPPPTPSIRTLGTGQATSNSFALSIFEWILLWNQI